MTSSAFDHDASRCLESHVELGGVECDRAEQTHVAGNGTVQLWVTRWGTRKDQPTATKYSENGISFVYERKVF